MAEAHPVGFRWAMKARERGAKIIHVDPHYSRTSAVSDIHVPIRAGSDIAFLGGLIRHIIETESYFKEYVVNYTNAATIVNEDFQDTEDLEGYFSGYDPETGHLRPRVVDVRGRRGRRRPPASASTPRRRSARRRAPAWRPATSRSDPTLQHPRCVFQLLKSHYARYTPEMVERVCGIPRETFLKVAETLIANSGRERTSMLVYARRLDAALDRRADDPRRRDRPAAARQHRPPGRRRSWRCAATPRSRARATSPRSTTCCPATCRCREASRGRPHARELHRGGRLSRAAGGRNFDKYIVSLLKAWFGDAATAENDYGFAHLPKISGNHSHFPTMLRAARRRLDGMFVMGQNPAVGSHARGAACGARSRSSSGSSCATSPRSRRRASGWTRRRSSRASCATEDISTEVFLMPAAAHVEKEGHFTNTQRLAAVARQGARPAGRRALGAALHAPPAKRRDGALRRLRRPEGLAAAQPALGLPGARAARASRAPRTC